MLRRADRGVERQPYKQRRSSKRYKWKCNHWCSSTDPETENILRDHPQQRSAKQSSRHLVGDEDLVINRDPSSAEEVRKADSSKKSGKAPSLDGVSADMLKAGGEIIVRTLTEIIDGAEEIPGDWKTELSA